MKNNKSETNPEGYEIHLKKEKKKTKFHKYRVNNVLSNLNIKPSDNILDLGCGAGTFTTEIKKLTSHVTGLDYNEYAIKICEKKGIKVIKSLSHSIPVEDNTYDMITAVDFFEHIPETVSIATLKECNRILKPGGRIAIYSPNNDIYEFFRFNPLHIGLKKIEEIKQLLMFSGFNIKFQKHFPIHVFPLNLIYKTRRILVIGEKIKIITK
jgi:ubiquinone/menaquinone biosynthesis C-methylase UbiE